MRCAYQQTTRGSQAPLIPLLRATASYRNWVYLVPDLSNQLIYHNLASVTWNLTVTGAQTLREFISEYCYFVWNWMLVYRPGHLFTNNLQLQIYIF